MKYVTFEDCYLNNRIVNQLFNYGVTHEDMIICLCNHIDQIEGDYLDLLNSNCIPQVIYETNY